MTVAYSTRDMHPRDRLSFWLEVATRAYCRHRFSSSSGASFLGSIQWGPLADLDVSVFECAPCEVGRTEGDVAHADCDDFLVSVLLSGRTVHGQDGRQAVGKIGSLVVVDARRPYTVTFTHPTRSVTVKIPRHALDARLGNVASLTARTMAPDGPIVGLVSGFLSMLPAQIDALDGAAASRIAERTLDLIALAFSVEADKHGSVLTSARASALVRLKAVIETRLSDPELKPAAAAAAAGISVRYANALLGQEGTSLERYVLESRLERCRRALDDPAQAHRMIGEIAYGWGFSDLSHFGRRFKAAFGLSPTDYRRQVTSSTSLASRRSHAESL